LHPIRSSICSNLWLTIKADEQEDVNFCFLGDANYVVGIPPGSSNPDGEVEVPKDYIKLNMSHPVPDLSDRHIGTDGEITVFRRPVFGFFCPGQVRAYTAVP
jgi:hypothetical protein